MRFTLQNHISPLHLLQIFLFRRILTKVWNAGTIDTGSARTHDGGEKTSRQSKVIGIEKNYYFPDD